MIDDYQIEAKLGEGYSSVVRQASRRDRKDKVALKIFRDKS